VIAVKLLLSLCAIEKDLEMKIYKDIPPVIPTNNYKAAGIHRQIELKVIVMLDAVPGAWHEPQDIMNYIAQHSYVQRVEFVKEIQND